MKENTATTTKATKDLVLGTLTTFRYLFWGEKEAIAKRSFQWHRAEKVFSEELSNIYA